MRAKASPKIEAEILRRIRVQSPSDSIAVLRGDRTYLLERVDELEEDRDLMVKRFDEDFDNAVEFYLESTVKDKVAKLKERIAELEEDIKVMGKERDETNQEYKELDEYNDDILKDHKTLEQQLDKSRQQVERLIESVWPTCPINPQMHEFPCGRCEADQSNAPGPCDTYLKCWQAWLDKQEDKT